MTDHHAQLRADLYDWGITLSEEDERVRRLDAYIDLLLVRNRDINLTAITALPDIYRLHVVDSLALAAKTALCTGENRSLADIGSGAGFPGLMLKLFYPNLCLTMMDAQKKRVHFLKEASALLFGEDDTVCALHGRAEDFGRGALRERFDLCTARAVSSLSVLAEYALPLLRVGGIFAAYKSADTDAEIADAKEAIRLTGGELSEVLDYSLPGSDVARRLVLIEKTHKTDARYPRRAGKAKIQPL